MNKKRNNGIDLTVVPRCRLEKAYQKACALIAHHLAREREKTDPDGELVPSPPAEHWEQFILYEVRRAEIATEREETL